MERPCRPACECCRPASSALMQGCLDGGPTEGVGGNLLVLLDFSRAEKDEEGVSVSLVDQHDHPRFIHRQLLC